MLPFDLDKRRISEWFATRRARTLTKKPATVPNSGSASENKELAMETPPENQEFKNSRLYDTVPEFPRLKQPALFEALIDYHYALLGARASMDGGSEHWKLVQRLWNDAIREAAWAAKHHRNPEELLIK